VAGGLAQCWMSGGDAVLHPRNRIVWQCRGLPGLGNSVCAASRPNSRHFWLQSATVLRLT